MCTNNESHEMMITSSKEANSSSKQEASSTSEAITKASSSSWLRFKDPRIVRVSRAFGGNKDRHSKVCTIRGLRDRRVRLSVPTAIQLYDLQERLGLSQPSKVVDWLINAAKDEIDELPPLPEFPSGNFGLNHQEILTGSSQSNKEGFRIEGSNIISWEGEEGFPRSNAWISSEALCRPKSKETAREKIDEKEINLSKKTDYEEKQDRVNEGCHGAEDSSINFLSKPSSTNTSLPNLLNNALPFGSSYYHMESSNFPFSQLGSHGFTSQPEDLLHNFNDVLPLPSALSLSSGSQILVSPPPGATQPLVEIYPRQINHLQMFSPSSHNMSANSLSQTPHTIGQSMRRFHFGFVPSHSGSASQSDKDQAFPSK